jgi:anti-sigma factor RsiW
MNHEQVTELIHPYVDGELDVSNLRLVEEHLQSCEACRSAEVRLRAFREALRSRAPAYRAPARLRKNIRTAVRREERAARPGLSWFGPWVAAAACTLLITSLVLFQLNRAARNSAADEVIGNHVRSLLATHLVDVASSDQHTVKPWFNGKVDFAPEVRDFANEGFPLVGGRVDYLDGKSAVALVYRRNQHPINVFVTPGNSETDAPPSAVTRRGYHLFQWARGGLNYWAVSDLNAEELRQFVTLFTGNTNSP